MNKISASLMCADYLNLKKDLDILMKTNVDLLHIDIMDGMFVNNFALNFDICKFIKQYCNIPLDIHLMINNPIKYMDNILELKPEYVSMHIDTLTFEEIKVIHQKCIDNGIKFGLAFSPDKNIDNYLLKYCDFVLVMTVYPGFAGQKFIDRTEEIKKINKEIQVDGGLSFENCIKCKNAGASIFVAGTSTIFNENDMEQQINKLKEILV